MEKLLTVSELRDLEKQVSLGQISYSRMVELINEKHVIKLVELRQKLQSELSSLREGKEGQILNIINKYKHILHYDGEAELLTKKITDLFTKGK